jgi:hypothetical protein
MMLDRIDRRYRERLGASYLVSVGFHAMLAALLFSIVSHASEEGATESVSGTSFVTIENVVAAAPAPARAAPVPHAPVVAPVRHAPLAQPARQPLPPVHHELSKFAPTAPPNPTPLPQASLQPNPVPTQPVFEPRPQNALPAVPTSVPSAPVVAVTITAPPTAAPTPAPTQAPTAAPTPHPAPTAKPTIAPTAAPVVAIRNPAAPSAPPIPLPTVSALPFATPGVPSPSPTKAPVVATARGAAPSPAPTGHASPGPVPGSAAVTKPGPARPVAVQATPSPAPAVAAPPKRRPHSGGSGLNARLNAMLPNNPVNPSEKAYHQTVALGSLTPTPPPAVLAATRFLYEERGTGGDARIKMWVTSTHREGPVTVCNGWLLRFPRSSQPAFQEGTAAHPVQGGFAIAVGGNPGGVGPPIVEGHASIACEARALVPFAPSPATSP